TRQLAVRFVAEVAEHNEMFLNVNPCFTFLFPPPFGVEIHMATRRYAPLRKSRNLGIFTPGSTPVSLFILINFL
ncbi:hypothetical protein P0Y35_13165, partial [Kiritimatiellaeota bacterium B1221]|nr:hypothetical protein [Kiritimatiellaeota bacterium B1221]